MKVYLLILFFNVALCKHYRNYHKHRIIGGKDVEIVKYGWQLSMLAFDSFLLCGASILNEKWAITAKHCVDNVHPFVLSIRAGSSYWNEGGTKHRVRKIIPYPDSFDVALIEISPPFDFENTVARAVSIPESGDTPDLGSEAIVTGWGRLENGFNPSHLQGVHVDIIDNDVCNDQYLEYGGIKQHELCAGVEEGGKDACQGDSGGPLIDTNNNLIGIVSWGVECGRMDFPGVYVSVAYPSVRKFIREQTGL